jgi:prepilin peptidase CpaA
MLWTKRADGARGRSLLLLKGAMAPRLLEIVPLLAALVLAAVQDWRCRRIANYLTIPLLAAGIARSMAGGSIGLPACLLGAGVGFGLMLALFAMRAVGGGDVKLMTALGAWLGAAVTLEVFAAAGIIGMIVVLSQAIAQGRLRILLRNTTVLTLSLAQADQVGIEHIVEMGSNSNSVRKPLPYAVLVLAATMFVLFYTNSI